MRAADMWKSEALLRFRNANQQLRDEVSTLTSCLELLTSELKARNKIVERLEEKLDSLIEMQEQK